MKGMTTEELKKSDLWWHGPDWLKKDVDQWPTWDVDQIKELEINFISQTPKKGNLMCKFMFTAFAINFSI